MGRKRKIDIEQSEASAEELPLTPVEAAPVDGVAPPLENAEPGGDEISDLVAPKTRRRGRPRSKAKSKSAGLDYDQIGKQVAAAHIVVGGVVGIPELAITEQEGAVLARAVSEALSELGVVVSQSTLAWVNLVGALGMVYVPRVIAYKNRVRSERSPHVNNGPGYDTPHY